MTTDPKRRRREPGAGRPAPWKRPAPGLARGLGLTATLALASPAVLAGADAPVAGAGGAALPPVPGLGGRDYNGPLADLVEISDPHRDQSWGSESFSASAQGVLKDIFKGLGDPAARAEAALADKLAPGFTAVHLRPPLHAVHRGLAFTVWRNREGAPAAPPPASRTGAAGLAEVLGALGAPFDPAAGVRTKLKVIGVTPPPPGDPNGLAGTRVRYEAAGRDARGGGARQQTATWNCTWTKPPQPGSPPLLKAITMEAFEEVSAAGGGQPLFADCTASAFGDSPVFREQLAYGADHWHRNLDVAFGIHTSSQGIALGDVDGDGLDDLYVCQPDGLPNRLFRHLPDGTLEDISARSGTDWLDTSRGVLLVDLDNDGDQDLVVSQRLTVTVSENLGGGFFNVLKRIDMPSLINSLAAADYDNDGDIDFFACGYSLGTELSPEDVFANPVPYHDATNGAPNFLLRNEGGFGFTDATKEAGLGVDNHRFSFAAAWEDFDDDGDQDLYVANDFGRNNLFRNEGATGPGGAVRFTDIAAAAGVEDVAAGMSVAWSDYDRDGDMDIYVSNMFSSAGNRITYQRQFKPGAGDETLSLLRRHARGNTLFANDGAGAFNDLSLEAGVTMGRWAWGSIFTDIDNDGWEDLYVTNGFMSSPDDPGDL